MVERSGTCREHIFDLDFPHGLQALKYLLFQMQFAQSGIHLHSADTASPWVGLKSHVQKGMIPQIALAMGHEPAYGSATPRLRSDAGQLT